MCRSLNGIRPLENSEQACAPCGASECTPQVRVDLLFEGLPYRLLLAFTSAKKVIHRGNWGALVFDYAVCTWRYVLWFLHIHCHNDIRRVARRLTDRSNPGLPPTQREPNARHKGRESNRRASALRPERGRGAPAERPRGGARGGYPVRLEVLDWELLSQVQWWDAAAMVAVGFLHMRSGATCRENSFISNAARRIQWRRTR